MLVTPENEQELKKGGIEPDAYVDIVKIESIWRFDHYKPKEGKNLNIWPDNSQVNDYNKFYSLKHKYGFSKYLHSNSWDETIYNRALQIGFVKSNIWIEIVKNNYSSKISTYGTVGAYYLDEPYSKNNVSLQTFDAIRNEIKTKTNNSLFITEDTKLVICLQPYVLIADNILCTQYTDGYEI